MVYARGMWKWCVFWEYLQMANEKGSLIKGISVIRVISDIVDICVKGWICKALLEQWQHQYHFRGEGRKWKMCVKHAKICYLSFLCWNCQIWSNSNTFEIISGGKLGGKKCGEKCPPVVLCLRMTTHDCMY